MKRAYLMHLLMLTMLSITSVNALPYMARWFVGNTSGKLCDKNEDCPDPAYNKCAKVMIEAQARRGVWTQELKKCVSPVLCKHQETFDNKYDIFRSSHDHERHAQNNLYQVEYLCDEDA